MIFVAIGTTSFSALVRAIDELAPTLDEEVVMQIGQSLYEPKNCKFFRFAPSLKSYYEQASLVISHGGLGIMTEVMEMGIPLVAVEDVDQPDRHQVQLLTIFSEQNYLVWCHNVTELAEAISEAKALNPQPYQKPECLIHFRIKDFVNELSPAVPRTRMLEMFSFK